MKLHFLLKKAHFIHDVEMRQSELKKQIDRLILLGIFGTFLFSTTYGKDKIRTDPHLSSPKEILATQKMIFQNGKIEITVKKLKCQFKNPNNQKVN